MSLGSGEKPAVGIEPDIGWFVIFMPLDAKACQVPSALTLAAIRGRSPVVPT
jgi:hypothetical protein